MVWVKGETWLRRRMKKTAIVFTIDGWDFMLNLHETKKEIETSHAHVRLDSSPPCKLTITIYIYIIIIISIIIFIIN